MSDMFAFTVTTKDKCRNDILSFDTAFQTYLQSKGVSLVNLLYKLEESKYTKWHAHGIYKHTWNNEKGDIFFAYFKPIVDEAGWIQYIGKQERAIQIAQEHFDKIFDITNKNIDEDDIIYK